MYQQALFYFCEEQIRTIYLLMKREKRAHYIGPDMEVVKLTFQGVISSSIVDVPGMQPGEFPKDDKPLFNPPAI